MTISTTTAAAAGRFVAICASLSDSERTQLLLALLELAFAEGAQHIAQTISADVQATIAVQKARTQ